MWRFLSKPKHFRNTARLCGIALGSALVLLKHRELYPVHCSFDPEPLRDSHEVLGKSQALLSRSFIADVVEEVSPSVVNIVCIGSGGTGGYFAPQITAQTGSGFIVTKSGYVVTNAHVVSSHDERGVLVTFSNGRKIKGHVHALDVASDIAVIKLSNDNGEEYPAATVGASSRIRAGDFVVAIGSPMMLSNSVSLGIISAIARHASELGMHNNRSEYLQTDAAINIGNSGGPLVNLDGEVIGINTMKVKGTDGISFAIPMDVASIIIKQLMTNGRVTRPFVGLKMALVVGDSDQRVARAGRRSGAQKQQIEMIMNSQPTKVMVLDVVRGSPASNAGLKSGDIIIEVNKRPVKTMNDVLNEVGLEVGKTLNFKVLRHDQGDVVHLSLTTAPEQR